MTRTKKFGIAAVAFVLVVVAARVAAPYYIVKYVNKTLDELDGYTGSVADVDLHIWRGAYQIEDVRILKEGQRGKKPIPLFAAQTIDISVEWEALLDGAIVAEIDLLSPKLNFVAEKGKESKSEDAAEKRDKERVAKGGESTWQKQVKELVPLKINRIGLVDGSIHYRDPHADPKVNVYVQKLYGEVTNLTNSEELSDTLAASAWFRGLALGSGKLKIDAKMDPYAKLPSLTLDAKLENLQIKQLNDFLKAYANVDAEQGTLSVYTEIATSKGRFKGYVKPLVRDLRIIRWKDEREGFFRKVWEGMVEAATEVIENHKKEQIATRIPFSGKLENPQADVLATALAVLRNAFIEALKGGLEREISLEGEMTAAKGNGE
jgi:hypothetical protein